MPGPGSRWNALGIWLWSRRPYCLASECSQQASVFKPPPPARLWNLFTAALGGLLEEPLRSCAQTEGELTYSWVQGPWARRGGRGGRASSGMESPPLPLCGPPSSPPEVRPPPHIFICLLYIHLFWPIFSSSCPFLQSVTGGHRQVTEPGTMLSMSGWDLRRAPTSPS